MMRLIYHIACCSSLRAPKDRLLLSVYQMLPDVTLALVIFKACAPSDADLYQRENGYPGVKSRGKLHASVTLFIKSMKVATSAVPA